MSEQYFLTICSLIVALIVAIVAVQQLLLSRQKFKLDLFEKRYDVYKTTQIFLTKIFRDAKIEMNDIFEFRKGTQDSIFLFKDDIPDYLQSIDKKALDFWEINENLVGIPIGEERSRKCREQNELLDWLIRQLPELKNKFAPYLKFKTWK